LAVAAARRSIQPDEEQPSKPVDDKRNHSRRDSCNEDRAMVVSFEGPATLGQDAGGHVGGSLPQWLTKNSGLLISAQNTSANAWR
jgi:hypothetical protein